VFHCNSVLRRDNQLFDKLTTQNSRYSRFPMRSDDNKRYPRPLDARVEYHRVFRSVTSLLAAPPHELEATLLKTLWYEKGQRPCRSGCRLGKGSIPAQLVVMLVARDKSWALRPAHEKDVKPTHPFR
jgi:hypothetical protein